MSWIVFALLSPAVYTLVNFVDKYIVEREVPDPRGIIIFTAILSAVSGTLFWLLGGRPLLDSHDAALVMLTGALTVGAAIFYFMAMSREAASNIILFLQMTPVVVFVLSLLFLGESLEAKKVVGFVMILGAAVAVSHKPGMGRFKLSAAFFLICGTALFQGTAFVLFDFVSGSLPFLTVLAYESWGIALGGVLVYVLVPPVRRAFNQDIAQMRRLGIAVIAINESFFIVAKTLAFIAITLGSATLVSALSSAGIFLGIVYGLALSLVAPHIFKENISRANLARKGFLASILFVGILMVN